MPVLATLVYGLIAAAHALAGAAWFGAMFYSLTVLHPRARKFFTADADLEEFLATLSRGARWKVLSAFGIVLLTGAALAALAWRGPVSGRWVVLVATKSVLFFVTLAVFCYASWKLWPARIFATPQESPAFRRKFRVVAVTMIVLVGVSLILGVLAHAW